MNPIFTSDNERGLRGYSFDEFVNEFDNICKQHLDDKRAKKFALIIFDFHSPTHYTLQNQGVFTELDRLSGKNITIFYLDGNLNKKRNTQNRLFKNLNLIIAELSNQNINTVPFILFFDFINGDVENINCYPIRDDEKFILNDLANSVTKELNKLLEVEQKTKTISLNSLIKDTPKIAYTEFIKMLIADIIK